MKILIFLIELISISSVNLIAQEINYTFNPIDATNIIDSISATNISSGKTAFVAGSNVISINSSTTGIDNMERSSGDFNVFPIPFDNKTELQFYSEQDDNIEVYLVNSLGQIVAINNQKVNSGVHRYEISTNSEGLFIVNVVGNRMKFSQKIIASGNNQNLNKIEYQGLTPHSNVEKSVRIEDADLIHFMIYSGGKITKIADAPIGSKTDYNVEFFECKDSDCRNYPIVQIREQWWMAENLAYLPSVNPPSDRSDSVSCYYVYGYEDTIVNDAKSIDNYHISGVLYNFPAAKESCPSGWHLPTHEDWEELSEFVSIDNGGYPHMVSGCSSKWYSVGNHLKSTIGWNNNGKGTDDYGFSGLSGGYTGYHPIFLEIGDCGWWWSSTEDTVSPRAWTRQLYHNRTDITSYNNDLKSGFSVRYIKD